MNPKASETARGTFTSRVDVVLCSTSPDLIAQAAEMARREVPSAVLITVEGVRGYFPMHSGGDS